jgi:hypothetical protein
VAKPFLYRCPVTGLNVQAMTTDHEGTDTPDRRPRHEMVHCLACGGVHLVDPTKGPKAPEIPE